MSSPPAERSAPTGASGLRRLLRDTSLAVRLSLLSAALAAAVVCASFTALSIQVRATVRELIASELGRSQRTLLALQRESRRHLVVSAALLAESPSLRSAIATYRMERQTSGATRADLTNTVERHLEQLGRDLGAGVLLATDEQGRVFASYVRDGRRPAAGTPLATLPAVRNALDPQLVSADGDAYLSGLEVGDAYYGVGVAPLIVDGFTIGTLVFGEPLDASMLGTLRSSFDGELLLTAGARVVSATSPAAVDSGGFLTAALPLGRTQHGTELRLTLLQPVEPSVRAVTGALQRDFLLYGTLAVLLAALGAALLARSLLHPLRRLVAFLREGARRERVDHPFDADGAAPEIRTLNASFSGLIASLQGQRDELARRGAELAAANAVLTDEVAERERIERALRESESQLRQSQKLEAVGTLAGGIAHDFNNLLTVISGFTQIAASRLETGHPAAADLREVTGASTSAATLTHQLLAFSRKQVLQPRVLDVEQIVSDTARMLRRLIGAGVELRVSHAGEPGRVRADPGQLEQVVLNLAVNARDAMPAGGVLTIATAHAVDASGARQVTMRVSDTGTGMSREVRDRIFEPFFTTKAPGQGTGLGLSTVYGIVAQSGGTIAVESEPGRGTTFVLAFPYVDESPEPEGHDAGEQLVRGSGRVLVVEDNDAVRAMIERSLAECGYEPVVARGGVEALARAAEIGHVDVLLTDVVMPQMTGPQLVERWLARHPGPVVVYMTGHVDESVMRPELGAGVVLLRKPFTPATLSRTLHAALAHGAVAHRAVAR